MTTRERPISPHIQIYRWQWTMLLLITHRITGLGLAVGTLLLGLVVGRRGERPGKLRGGARLYVALGRPVAALRLDLGLVLSPPATASGTCSGMPAKGFELPTGYATGWIVVIASFGLTGLAWIIAYGIL